MLVLSILLPENMFAAHFTHPSKISKLSDYPMTAPKVETEPSNQTISEVVDGIH